MVSDFASTDESKPRMVIHSHGDECTTLSGDTMVQILTIITFRNE